MVSEIIGKLADQWGNDWPKAAFERFLYLHLKQKQKGLNAGECDQY